MPDLIKKAASSYRWVRNSIISLFIANILILIGKDDWIGRFKNPLHYLDMLVTFLSVYIILEIIDRVNFFLNKKFEWTKETFKRVIYQLLFAIIVPVILSILITFIQWEFIWHQDLFKDNYFKYEFFPQVLLILIINLFFVVIHLFKVRVPRDNEVNLSKTPSIIGRKGGKKIPVQVSEISYIQLKQGIVYLITFEGEEFFLSENLDHFEKILPPSHFFRANRQFIIRREACKSFASGTNGKVDVTIFPALATIQVSQKRAANFRSWIST
ncbi:LytR/AlgR family response regulator transcription factor [Algoriphagus halophilus]|uniref:LytTr DNA-binding domain-containing protein n=1 Tax=Algoriphagus halophilus TaxID=226505 RepID=A0A1N6DUH0_9BACT|nr:LytTR family DNA-binding domain-containing protein [Algoriphagus halophilus]SIN74334.1 LytTr DNA-binding domain-containing protein [Algoriphagus halophilus]